MLLGRALRLHFAILLASATTGATAWGADGHRIIAALAEERLSPSARVEAIRLLQLEGSGSLGTVASWADEVRSEATASWHYINAPEDCTYDAPRDCPDGRCVIEAIEKQAAVLRSQASDARRLRALKFLVHLVGDAHQPLHAGGKDHDRGGNLHQIRAWGKGSNLHALWDSGLIKNRNGGIGQLLADVRAASSELPSTRSTVRSWAEESCQATQRIGFYPTSRKVGTAYAAEHDALLVERLARASVRLASLLNSALEPTDSIDHP